MADIFAFYDCSPDAPAGQAAKVTLWERGWRNRGWKPRLITIRQARKSKFYAKHRNNKRMIPLLALHAAGGGWLSPVDMMNFSFKPCTPRKAAIRFYTGLYYATRSALERHFRGDGVFQYGESLVPALIRFKNPEDALTCGLKL